MLSRPVEVFPLPIDDWQRPLQTVVLGGEVFQNPGDNNSLTSLVILSSPSGTSGISSVGNLRFCTGYRRGFLPAPDLNSKLSAGGVVAACSVSELVAELCTVSLETDTWRYEVLSSWYKWGSCGGK